jgi:hypothetical protein
MKEWWEREEGEGMGEGKWRERDGEERRAM